MSCECLVHDLVDISGLCDLKTINLSGTNNNFWTEISVPETLIIPEQKPDIEQILSVNIATNIMRTKVIPTPISQANNIEGKALTGRKLIIEGELCQTVSYTAAVLDQKVHSTHFVVPFSAYIVIPRSIFGVDTLKLNFQVNVCIEDVFIREVSDRCIFKNVVLLLQAVLAPIAGCPNSCERETVKGGK